MAAGRGHRAGVHRVPSAAASAPGASPSGPARSPGRADIVVTNHALLAIDALEDGNVLPEHDVVIIDEAHDLVDRVTSIATAELSAPAVDAAARRCGKQVTDDVAGQAQGCGRRARAGPGRRAGRAHRRADRAPGRRARRAQGRGRIVRNARSAPARRTPTTSPSSSRRGGPPWPRSTSCTTPRTGCSARSAQTSPRARTWCGWTSRADPDARRPPTLRVAPLAVGGLLAERLFGRRTVALTSATLSVGGSFDPLARQWGLPARGRRACRRPRPAAALAPAASETVPPTTRQQVGDEDQERRRAAPSDLVRDRRRLTVRPPAQRHPLRGAAPAAAGP